MTTLIPGAPSSRRRRARSFGLSVLATFVFTACGATSRPPPSVGVGAAAPSAMAEATPQSSASGGQSPDPAVVIADAAPTALPTPGPTVPHVPTLQAPAHTSRVVVPGMSIDLPVISGDVQPPPSYPFCDVAAYVTRFNQPYEAGVTYISAHAQKGMFLPLLQSERANDGTDLIGREVDVYTSDGQMFAYRVDQIVEHATDYAILDSIPLDQHVLVLQTSEGPYGTIEKMQVVASLQSQMSVPLADANPEPHPRDCEPSSTSDPDSSPGAQTSPAT